MRLTVARLRRVVKADLPIEFVPQHLTSYGGLELLRRTSACSGCIAGFARRSVATGSAATTAQADWCCW